MQDSPGALLFDSDSGDFTIMDETGRNGLPDGESGTDDWIVLDDDSMALVAAASVGAPDRIAWDAVLANKVGG